MAVVLALTLLAMGCGANGGSGASASSDPPEESPYEAGLVEKDSRRTGQPNAARTAPSPPGREPRAIPGMNADDVGGLFLRPGLECLEPVEGGVLYACTSEENPNMTLLYEGEVEGRGADRVSGVEARVHRRGGTNFGVAAQPFFGLLATHLEYSGADKERAYGFVNRNLNSEDAATVIGAAEWTMASSRNRKVLTVVAAED